MKISLLILSLCFFNLAIAENHSFSALLFHYDYGHNSTYSIGYLLSENFSLKIPFTKRFTKEGKAIILKSKNIRKTSNIKLGYQPFINNLEISLNLLVGRFIFLGYDLRTWESIKVFAEKFDQINYDFDGIIALQWKIFLFKYKYCLFSNDSNNIFPHHIEFVICFKLKKQKT